MCRVYNTIGCLNTIQFNLVNHNIDDFNSLNELIEFKNNYSINKQKIISDHTQLLEEEKNILTKDILEFNLFVIERKKDLKKELRQKLDYYNQEIDKISIPTPKIILTLKNYWINLILCIKFWFIQILFYFRIRSFTYHAKKMLLVKNDRLKYISTEFQKAVSESSFNDLSLLESKQEIIENLNNTIYGAYGENKVEIELIKLMDDYILINDFCYTFKTPLNHNGEFIKSIQIDHLLISPSGIFLIETKNWSKDSINNLDLRSPVQQILRTNYALFKILENKINQSNWNFTRQQWGKRKIPLKNIIVFTNTAPKEQFQFVKILGLNELLYYVKYFNPSFTKEETQQISDFLLTQSEHREIISKLSI